MSRISWLLLILLRYYRNLGLRVSFYALLSLIAALSSPVVRRYLPPDMTQVMDFTSVMPVLTILATSMLAVSTFSLNIMVSAHRAAAGSTTPRVHRLLLENTTTQSVLATFIGAFVYSLTSIILYQAGFYPESAAIVVMAVTILVVVLVVVAMLRWIQHLTNLGSVDDSIRTATDRAREALIAFARNPALGGTALTHDIALPPDPAPLKARVSGHVQIIDVPRLQECLPEGIALYMMFRPGAHVLEGQVIGHLTKPVDDSVEDALCEAFTIGGNRTYEQDAEYGLVVLSEIASKALSPGINDAGTAIATVLSLKTLLWHLSLKGTETSETCAPDVYFPLPDLTALFAAAFTPIARDGAGTIEVALHLRKALHELAQSPNKGAREAARTMADRAFEYSNAAQLLEAEIQQLTAIEFDRIA